MTEPLNMAYYGDPILRKVAEQVNEITDDILVLGQQMITTMQQHHGIGLAGNQIGRALRIVALSIPKSATYSTIGEAALLTRMPMVIINPTLSEFHGTSRESEGCLSMPGVKGYVSRPERVRLQATSLNGQKLDMVCGGLLARCLQHEVDHLNGVLFSDHFNGEDKRRTAGILKKLKKRLAN